MGNGGDDVEHYDIDLRFAPDTYHIDASTAITAGALEDLSSVNLDLHGLSVEWAMVDGATADFEQVGSEPVITPAMPLARGATFSATVVYADVPEPIVDPGLAFVPLGWQAWDDGFFGAINEPSGAMNWFPSNTHPSNKANYTMRITVPADLKAVANGVMAAVSINDDGTLSFVWKTTEPMASYLTIVAVGDYVEVRDDSGPVPMRNYFPAGFDTSAASGYDVTQDIMTRLNGEEMPAPHNPQGRPPLAGRQDYRLHSILSSSALGGP